MKTLPFQHRPEPTSRTILSTPSHPRALKAVETAGEKLGVELRAVPIRTVEDFDGAFATMTQERVLFST